MPPSTQLGPPGTLGGSERLDQPPPSPALSSGMNPGMPLPGEMQLPTLASGQLPPDILTGMTQTLGKMASDVDAIAQMAPDLAADCAAVRATLSALMSKVLVAGAGPISPTAPGPGFPGGGIDRGAMPLASGGGS